MAVLSTETPSVFVENVTSLLERVEFRRADSAAAREAIFRLRYEGYLHAGTIGANPFRRFTDEFDDMPNSILVGLHIDDDLVASIRISVATRDYPDIPAMRVFKDILGPMVETGRIVVDPTRNVVSLAGARLYPKLPYLTARVGWLAGEYFRADLILATVRTEHQAFFRRTFGHRLICDARPYPALQKPISLMTLEYQQEKERVLRRYPFYASTAAERRSLFEATCVLRRLDPRLADGIDVSGRRSDAHSPPGPN
jgi:hypothetical protein